MNKKDNRMDKKEMLEAIITHFAYGNKSQFAKMLGVMPQTISSWISRKTFDIELVYAKCEGINADWLLSGHGDMIRFEHSKMLKSEVSIDGETNSNVDTILNSSHEKQTTTTQFSNLPTEATPPIIHESIISSTAIPFYDLPVSAGELGVLNPGSEPNKKADGFIDMPIFSGCEKVLPVVGISMEPIIFSGDFIGIKSIPDISSRWDFLHTGKIYLIVTHEELMIKYISQANDTEYIVCTSPNYSPFKVHKSEVLQVFRVAAIARGL